MGQNHRKKLWDEAVKEDMKKRGLRINDAQDKKKWRRCCRRVVDPPLTKKTLPSRQNGEEWVKITSNTKNNNSTFNSLILFTQYFAYLIPACLHVQGVKQSICFLYSLIDAYACAPTHDHTTNTPFNSTRSVDQTLLLLITYHQTFQCLHFRGFASG